MDNELIIYRDYSTAPTPCRQPPIKQAFRIHSSKLSMPGFSFKLPGIIWRDAQRLNTLDCGDFNRVESWNYGSKSHEMLLLSASPPFSHVFTLREMQEATSNFCSANLLGEGGFGRVYRGILRTGQFSTKQVVAIKQMDYMSPRVAVQGDREFRVEVDILTRLNHPNLMRLIGYCADKFQRLLVYEFMTHGNLGEHLYGMLRVKIDWPLRVRIALDSARGLCYLHSGPEGGNIIIHRDFKSSNILLDDKFQAKLSDFGLAKLVPINSTSYLSTRVLGTFGYLDPQYIATGHVTLKSDVYGFGVVLLELLTGRRPVDGTQPLTKQNLVTQMKGKLKCRRKLKRIIDPEISRSSYNLHSVASFASLASRCVKQDGNHRPSMFDCVRELEQILFESLKKG